MKGSHAEDGVEHERMSQSYLGKQALPDVSAAGLAADAEAGGPCPVVKKSQVVDGEGACCGTAWLI
jgi:hypothetical protein